MKLSTKSAERVQVSERDSVGITKLEGTLSASGMHKIKRKRNKKMN